MPIQIKVHGGVFNGDPRGLCNSCEYGMVREDARNTVEVHCTNYDFGRDGMGRMRAPITRCTGHAPRGTVSRHELEKLSWNITVDKKTGKVGFLTPKDRLARETGGE